MLFRFSGEPRRVTVDGVPVTITRDRDYDDEDPGDKALIDRFRSEFYAPNVEPAPVESATARPGERRSTRRKR